ncbi:hypothetical protein GQ457_01G054820 [Hibiscus cannabinus]
MDFKHLLFVNHVHWDILFGSLLWCLWKKQNDWNFGDLDRYSEPVLQCGLRLQQEAAVVCSTNAVVQLRGVVPTNVHWHNPHRVGASSMWMVRLVVLSVWRVVEERLIIVPSIIYYIAELLNRAWSVKLCHIGRNGNGVADWMAKFADFDDFICHRFLSLPVEVGALLISEATH